MNDRVDEKSDLCDVLPDFIPDLYITGAYGSGRRIVIGLWYVSRRHEAPVVTGNMAGRFWLPEGEVRFVSGSNDGTLAIPVSAPTGWQSNSSCCAKSVMKSRWRRIAPLST